MIGKLIRVASKNNIENGVSYRILYLLFILCICSAFYIYGSSVLRGFSYLSDFFELKPKQSEIEAGIKVYEENRDRIREFSEALAISQGRSETRNSSSRLGESMSVANAILYNQRTKLNEAETAVSNSLLALLKLILLAIIIPVLFIRIFFFIKIG